VARSLGDAFVSVKATGETEFLYDTQKMADAAGRISAAVSVTADTRDATVSMDKLRAKVADLAKQRADITISAKDKDALAAMARIDLRLDLLNDKVAKPDISVRGELRALADIASVDAALDALGKKQAEPAISARIGTAIGDKLKEAPWWLGPALGLLPGVASLGAAGLGAGVAGAGLGVAGGGAAGAFAAVAKPVLSAALTASQAVNAAQNAYQATLAAGVPAAAAQATLSAANAKAQNTYNAALAAGGNPAKALASYHLALAQNQTSYNAAVNQGTFNAKAYQTEQLAIAKAYAGMSPAQIELSRQLGAMSDAWDKVKAAQTPVVAGALAPWLQAVTDLTGQLGPIIAAVAPVLGSLGKQFDVLVGSPAFTEFTDFIAGTGSHVIGELGRSALDIVDGLITLLPQLAPLIDSTATGIGHMADKFEAWAVSAQARQDVGKFLQWMHDNGPAVGTFIENVGKVLGRLAPGLTAGGVTELKVISDFLGLVAKLPKGIAGPITEVAGAALVLAKLPGGTKVISFAVNLLGKGAGALLRLLGLGGVAEKLGLDVTGADTAAATIRAAMVSGGEAAAAEIRAAMVSGGTAAAAEGEAGAAGGAGAAAGGAEGEAAGGAGLAGLLARSVLPLAAGFFGGQAGGALFNKFGPGATTPGGVWARTGTEVGAGALAGAAVGSVVPVIGTAVGAGIGALGGLISGILANPKESLKGVEEAFDDLRHHVANVFDGIRGDVHNYWNMTWTETIGRAIQFGHDVEDVFNNVKQWIWNDFLLKIYDWFTSTLPQWWSDAYNFAVKNFIDPVKQGYSDLRQWLYDDFILQIADFFTVTLPHYWDVAYGFVVSKFVDPVKGIFGDLKTWIWTDFLQPVVTFFDTTLPDAFTTAWHAIGATWSHVESAISGPIQAVLHDTIGKLFGYIDDVTSFVHLGSPLPRNLAAGGLITDGTGPTADDVPAWVSRGETVVSAAHSAILAPWFASLGVPGYAGGGIPLAGTGPGTSTGAPPSAAPQSDKAGPPGSTLIPGAGSRFGPIPGVGGIKVPGGGVAHDIASFAAGLFGGAGDVGKILVALATGNATAAANAFAALLGGPNAGGAGGNLGAMLLALPGELIADAVKFLIKPVTSYATKAQQAATAGYSAVPARSGSAAAAQAFASAHLAQFGWGQDQMAPLIALWNQESGWNANAVNPSSGAYGIPQSLGHGHPYNLGDYANQVLWGLSYIKSTYGSPAAAEAHELAYHWYASGGVPLPGMAAGGVPDAHERHLAHLAHLAHLRATGQLPAAAKAAASGKPAPVTTLAAFRDVLAAEQATILTDYADFTKAATAALAYPAPGSTLGSHHSTVLDDMATMAKRQGAEATAYKALSGKGLTATGLASLAAAVKAEITTSRDKALGYLPGTTLAAFRNELTVLAGSAAHLPSAGGKPVNPAAPWPSLFETIALPKPGTPGYDTLAGIYGWYDAGGWLPPGMSMAWNGTGQPERVSPPGSSGPAAPGNTGTLTQAQGWMIIDRLNQLITIGKSAPAAYSQALNGMASTAALQGYYGGK